LPKCGSQSHFGVLNANVLLICWCTTSQKRLFATSQHWSGRLSTSLLMWLCQRYLSIFDTNKFIYSWLCILFLAHQSGYITASVSLANYLVISLLWAARLAFHWSDYRMRTHSLTMDQTKATIEQSAQYLNFLR